MSGRYKYTIEGVAGMRAPHVETEQTYTCTGVVESEEFTQLFTLAMRDSFWQLTHGKAVFGHPGVGCKGPYHITRFTLEEVTQ